MKFVLVLFLLYIFILAATFWFQEKLLFFPQEIDANHNFNLPDNGNELFLKTTDNQTINAIFLRTKSPRVILYFHGNGTSLLSWQRIADILLPHGSVMMIDYRGYGKSTGTFSEAGFYTDAETAISYLIKQGYTTNQIIIYGRSLGSGIAIEMGVRHKVGGLILESPYTSVVDVGKKQRPYLLPQLLLKYRFYSLAKAPKITSPALIVHGVNDATIPIEHGRKMAAALSNCTLVTIDDGDHANLSTFPVYNQAINDFLSRIP